jgi:hypothetical protein
MDAVAAVFHIDDLKEHKALTRTAMQRVSGGSDENFCGTIAGPSLMPGACYTPPWMPGVPGWIPNLEPAMHILPI